MDTRQPNGGTTHSRDSTFTRIGETRALQTLKSGLALAREHEAEKMRKALVDADQRMRAGRDRRSAFKSLLRKL